MLQSLLIGRPKKKKRNSISQCMTEVPAEKHCNLDFYPSKFNSTSFAICRVVMFEVNKGNISEIKSSHQTEKTHQFSEQLR